MQFTISSTTLNNRLQTLSKVINSKNTLQILDSFLFEITDGELHITASDSENVLQSHLALDAHEGEGTFAVNSQTILNALRELPEQPLQFNINTNMATISIAYQGGEYNFTIQDATDYPKVATMFVNPSVITIDANILSSNINRSIFALGVDDLRPVMTGIYFDLATDSLSIVASDGHKLVRNRNLLVKSDAPASFILPRKPAMLLKNILTKDGGDVVIKFDNRSAEITYAEGKLTCRLIEGRYPNYNSVIPQDNPNQLVIDRKALLSALKRVLPFGSKSSQLIKLSLDAGALEVSSEDIDYSTKAHESILCEYTGRKMSIGFKGSSLTDILSNLESEEVTIELGDPSRAGLIMPSTQPENEDVLTLVMPMLLNE